MSLHGRCDCCGHNPCLEKRNAALHAELAETRRERDGEAHECATAMEEASEAEAERDAAIAARDEAIEAFKGQCDAVEQHATEVVRLRAGCRKEQAAREAAERELSETRRERDGEAHECATAMEEASEAEAERDAERAAHVETRGKLDDVTAALAEARRALDAWERGVAERAKPLPPPHLRG